MLINHRLHVREGKPVDFCEETLQKVRLLAGRYPEGKQKSALLPVLHMAQEELGGYLSVDIMDYVAALLQLEPIEVYEVATFYSMFYLEPVGKYVIEVCHTAPCAICGGEEILEYLEEKLNIKVGETTPDGLFTLRTVECLGGCGNAPVLQVNSQFHEQIDRAGIDRLLDKLRKDANEPANQDLTWERQFC